MLHLTNQPFWLHNLLDFLCLCYLVAMPVSWSVLLFSNIGSSSSSGFGKRKCQKTAGEYKNFLLTLLLKLRTIQAFKLWMINQAATCSSQRVPPFLSSLTDYNNFSFKPENFSLTIVSSDLYWFTTISAVWTNVQPIWEINQKFPRWAIGPTHI